MSSQIFFGISSKVCYNTGRFTITFFTYNLPYCTVDSGSGTKYTMTESDSVYFPISGRQ